MATWTGFARTAALCATFALAPGLLIATSHRADAGIFSWLGGRNQNNSDGYQQSAPNGGGLFGNRGGGGGIFQPAPRAPQSGAFHGDELPPEEAKSIPQVPGSLDAVLDALEADHDFLLEGGVFTKDLIETWIEYKRTVEIDALRLRPHPYEFALYYDI